MPVMFSKRYPYLIPLRVTCEDPLGNTLNLGMVKQGNNTWLANGWRYLAKFYGLHDQGGWVHMKYDGAKKFKIRVYTRQGVEITYPPMPKSLVDDNSGVVLDTNAKNFPLKLIDYRTFHVRLVKWVTYEELLGDTMVLI